MSTTLIFILALVACVQGTSNKEGSDEFDFLMPGVSPMEKDTYLCHATPLDSTKPIYITGFVPQATSDKEHHILVFGCSKPGSNRASWDCGQMAGRSRHSPICQGSASIIYAWAKDAPELELPHDVGFKVGGDSEIAYLVIQIHYSNVDSFLIGGVDRSGVRVLYTPKAMPRTAGVMLLTTGGYVQPGQEEHFEVSCRMNEDVVLHPFAFRTHSHQLGRVSSGYRVRGSDWTEIGRRSPLLPNMFVPATNSVAIKKGDQLAARCTMFNFNDHAVGVGPTNDDEMCNFYIMYFVDGERTLSQSVCFSPGPPLYRWNSDKNLDASKVPANASVVPPPPNGPDPKHPQHQHL